MSKAHCIQRIARVSILLPALAGLSQTMNAQQYQWAAVYNDNGMAMRGMAVAPDGSIYVTGIFGFDVDMDPGPGTWLMTGAGSYDAFLSKFTPDGMLAWSLKIGGTEEDGAWDVAVDPQGNVLWGGWFQGNVDLDPGAGVVSATATGSGDAFVLKLTPAGSLIWSRTATGPGQQLPYKIAVDHQGAIWVTGAFNDVTDFDPGPSTFLLAPPMSQLFLWKLSADGDFAYAGMFSNYSYSTNHDLAIDAGDDVYVSQAFISSMDADPGPGVQNITPGGIYPNTLLTKLSSNGDLLWNRHVYAEGYMKTLAPDNVVIDSDGNVVVHCWFDAPADLDPGPGVLNLAPVTPEDNLLWKLDPDGNVLQAVRTSAGENMDVDPSGRMVFSGTFDEEYDADPGPGTVIFTPASWRTDIFVTALEASGTHIWSGAIGAEMDDVAFDQEIDADGNIIIIGYVQSEVDMDPGPGSAMFDCLAEIGDRSWFVLKLGALATSVNETVPARGTILPSVVDDILVITTEQTGATATIRDLRGATVASKRLVTQRTEMDLSHLPAGPYMVDVLSTEGRTATRVIKL